MRSLPSALFALAALCLVALGPVALGLVAASAAAQAGAETSEQSVRPGINDKYLADDLDVESWRERFEVESREIYARRAGIVAALELSPGMTVADVGAGTGVFMAPFAAAVGKEGRVLAVDVSPRFVEHLRERVADEKLEQVEVVRGGERSVGLPAASVDVAFVCDTYHHFEYPRSTLASLHRAIRPGGSLVVVDFERVPGQSPDWLLEHVRADKQTFTKEITAAGFTLDTELEVEGVEQNYILRFHRP